VALLRGGLRKACCAGGRMSELVTFSELQRRGWTESMVKNFLSPPCETRENPHYRSGPRMRLWRLERVAEAEQMPGFVRARDLARLRSERSKQVTERRREALLAQIEEISVEVTIVPNVLQRAIEHYNAWNAWNPHKERASVDSEPEFLERITVNFIRHELTLYDRELEAVAGKVGVRDAVDLIRCKVFDAIAEAYPEYAAECLKQSLLRGL